MLAGQGAADLTRLSFVAADLTSDAGRAEAVAGCDYGLHLASPFPANIPKHEDELIIPARDGALRVLKAARDAGVKRVVLTSSFAAVGYGHPRQRTPFTEADWTVLDGPDTSAYAKSKTIAERAAWGFVKAEGGGLELAVVNPVGVFGPGARGRLRDLDPHRAASHGRRLPRLPRPDVRRWSTSATWSTCTSRR